MEGDMKIHGKTTEELRKCSHLLPEPGPEVVAQLLDALEDCADRIEDIAGLAVKVADRDEEIARLDALVAQQAERIKELERFPDELVRIVGWCYWQDWRRLVDLARADAKRRAT